MQLNFYTNTTRNINGTKFRGNMDNNFERKDILKDKIQNTLEAFIERSENEFPQNFRYINPQRQLFLIPDTNNIAFFQVAHDRGYNDNLATLSLCVQKDGSDTTMQNILMNGTKEEITQYLRSCQSEKELEKLEVQILNLSSKIDNHFNKL